jgi:hypothetical protein
VSTQLIAVVQVMMVDDGCRDLADKKEMGRE